MVLTGECRLTVVNLHLDGGERRAAGLTRTETEQTKQEEQRTKIDHLKDKVLTIIGRLKDIHTKQLPSQRTNNN